MKDQYIDTNSLESILEKTVDIIEKSKEQIFEIGEDARGEKESLSQKLESLNHEIGKIIEEVDSFEVKYRQSRRNLSLVSKNFNTYSEHDIQKAYEEANQLQLDLYIAREREMNLKTNRNDLQLRLKHIDLTIERAEMLITQVSVVFNYLAGDIIRMTEMVESAKLSQMFGLKIIQAQEEERKRVAREIHDGPAQSMANVVLRTEIAERLMNHHKTDQAIQELKDLKSMIRQSLADVRQIIFDLRPMVLDDLGLLPTLRKFIPEIAKREGLSVELNLKGKERRLPSGIEVAVFRLIQEVINNVIKHAQATKFKVDVELTKGNIKFRIQDDGVGFIEEEVLKKREHFGLIGMKERVQLLEGNYDIKSEKDKGTTISFMIPINESGETSNESNDSSNISG